MSLLDHPEAQALLNDANVTPNSVKGCADRLIGLGAAIVAGPRWTGPDSWRSDR